MYIAVEHVFFIIHVMYLCYIDIDIVIVQLICVNVFNGGE